MRLPATIGLMLAAGFAIPAPPLQAQADDRAQVLAVVQQVFDGMRTKDTALVLGAFVNPEARLLGVRRGQLSNITAREFAGYIVGDAEGEWLERMFEPEVRIDGVLASVWAPYDFHRNKVFSHCGVDAVQLLKIDGAWKIAALSDSAQREGCPTRPAP